MSGCSSSYYTDTDMYLKVRSRKHIDTLLLKRNRSADESGFWEYLLNTASTLLFLEFTVL